MCGIAGIWGRMKPESDAQLGAMLDAMQHRGPDGRGVVAWRAGAAGMVRLALVDLSPAGQQPLYSDGRDVAILFNGECYNFREERARLEGRGHRFRTGTDTEVVLGLYLEHGDAFVERLVGMYAVAIVDFRGDPDRPKLLLSRDPLGIKPLYITGTPRTGIAFASELRALVRGGQASTRLDASSVSSFLTWGFVPEPATMLAEARMLAAGTTEVFGADARHLVSRHYRIPAHTRGYTSMRSAAEELRSTLESSIALHAFADAEVGAFLSGGTDSTAIVALMRRHVTGKLSTFTLRFPDVPGVDEADAAAAWARELGCEHFTVDVGTADISAKFEGFARSIDQPSTDGFNTWLVSEAAGRSVKGALSGLGADELFGGYPSSRRIAGLSRGVGPALSAVARVSHAMGLRSGRANRLAARRDPLSLWAYSHAVFSPTLAVEMSGGRPVDPKAELEGVLALEVDSWRDDPPIENASVLDTAFYMRNQLLRDADAMSMAHSLEVRVPFLHPDLVALARRCSPELKVAPTRGRSAAYGDSGAKRVLIEAVRDVLPRDILSRPKKGFSLPFNEWIAGPLRPRVDRMFADGSRLHEAIDVQVARRAARAAHGFPKMLALLVLDGWLESLGAQRTGSMLASTAAN